METLKAKYIKIEIDGTTYAGFIQEVKEAAAETATSDNQDFKNQQFNQNLIARDEQYWKDNEGVECGQNPQITI